VPDRTDDGPSSSAAMPEAAPVDSRAAEFVTETLFQYDGGRPVSVYVPPDPPEAVVFAGDGEGFSKWGRFLEKADLPPTMIVGVHGLSEEMARLGEYSPAFDDDRFAAHEKFFVEDVRRWVKSRFGVSLSAERTAVFGYSAGGELALALGLRHPDVYGVVISGSPGGGYQPTGTMPASLPRVYLFAGALEPFFLDNATRWSVALREAGADVMMNEQNVSHGAKLWRAEFPLMLAWAFGQ
jgi:enterochelin esterase-like enzyme